MWIRKPIATTNKYEIIIHIRRELQKNAQMLGNTVKNQTLLFVGDTHPLPAKYFFLSKQYMKYPI